MKKLYRLALLMWMSGLLLSSTLVSAEWRQSLNIVEQNGVSYAVGSFIPQTKISIYDANNVLLAAGEVADNGTYRVALPVVVDLTKLNIFYYEGRDFSGDVVATAAGSRFSAYVYPQQGVIKNLKLASGDVVPNKTVRLYDKTTGVFLGEGETDETGKVMLPAFSADSIAKIYEAGSGATVPLAEVDLTATGSLDQESIHLPVATLSTNAVSTASASTWWWWLGGGVVGLLVLVMWFVLKQKRH